MVTMQTMQELQVSLVQVVENNSSLTVFKGMFLHFEVVLSQGISTHTDL